MSTRWSCALGVLAAALAASCGFQRICPRVEPQAGVPGAGEGDVAYVKFLGVGGFLIEFDGHVLMTAPLYSNPTIGEIATQPAFTDHRLISALLPDVSRTEAILSGHSHYDHLMDVPWVALNRAPQATVYGNDDMTRLLAPLDRPQELGGRLVSLEDEARTLEPLRHEADCESARAHRVSTSIRIWPIISEHSPQFGLPRLPLLPSPPAVHLWRGTLLQPRTELPERPGDWVEGTTLAYLIDFMKGDRIALRVYYQDSGSRKPYGFPPACLLKGRKVDLALLCVGGGAYVPGHPTDILTHVQPRFVMAGHWEDFFNPRELPLPRDQKNRCCEKVAGLPLQSPRRFLEQVRTTLPTNAWYVLPCPDAWARFKREPGEAWGEDQVWRLESSSDQWSPGRRRP